MSRIARCFAALRREGRGALIPFVEAFDPDRETSMALLSGMPKAGADLIEVGVPFTDPMADGPTIQAASKRALAGGATVRKILAMIRAFREENDVTPIILMGYLNPVFSYGPERFCQDAASAGVDGLILVDMPPEEADIVAPFAKAQGLDLIPLVAPTTNNARLPKVLTLGSGFIYYVSITGITGTKTATAEQLAAEIPRIRQFSSLPVAVGFGVRTPAHVREVVRHADAAVVASALIDTLAAELDGQGRAREGAVSRVLAQVESLAAAVRNAPRHV